MIPVMAIPEKKLPPSSEEEFIPRTPIARELWQARQRIIESGEPLLDWDELEREVAERRGGGPVSR
jgi:hypothetical protein